MFLLFSNSSDEEVSECGCIEENKSIEELRSDPYTLPQGFVWDTLDISNEKVVCWNLLPERIIVQWTRLEPLISQSQQRKGWRMVPRKNMGLGKFCQDLEISEAFMISLEVSFFHGLFNFTFLSLETFYQRVSSSDF